MHLEQIWKVIIINSTAASEILYTIPITPSLGLDRATETTSSLSIKLEVSS